MNNDLEILNSMTDEEWTANGIYVEDSNGDMVAATQDIEDARYIATFNPKHQRELSERMAALESVLQGIINYAFDPTETAFEPHLDKAMRLMNGDQGNYLQPIRAAVIHECADVCATMSNACGDASENLLRTMAIGAERES